MLVPGRARFDEYCFWVVVLIDYKIHRLEFIVAIGDGVGDLAPGGGTLGAALDLLFLQGLEGDDLISHPDIVYEGRGHRHFGILVKGDIDPDHPLSFQPAFEIIQLPGKIVAVFHSSVKPSSSLHWPGESQLRP